MKVDGLTIKQVRSADPTVARFSASSVVHRCPIGDSGIMSCCGQTPFEVPRWHRMTLDPNLVTCASADKESRTDG